MNSSLLAEALEMFRFCDCWNIVNCGLVTFRGVVLFQFADHRQVKWQKQARANLHYQQRLLSLVINAWKVRCFL